MGSDKRERQKANRQLRLEEMARAQQQQKTKRRVLIIGIGVIAAVALAAGFSLLGGDDDDGEAQTTTTVATGAATDPTATSAATPTDPVATTTECPPADGSAPRTTEFAQAPPMCIDPAKSYTAQIETSAGPLTIELDAAQAPLTVNNFVVLARYHFYDGITCHRAIPGFMVQCGDPEGTGSGGPGYAFADELPADGAYQIGSVAMANSGPDTNGSQFFMITGEQGVALPPNYSLFGQITDGLDTTLVALDELGNPDPAANGVPPVSPIEITSVTITES